MLLLFAYVPLWERLLLGCAVYEAPSHQLVSFRIRKLVFVPCSRCRAFL